MHVLRGRSPRGSNGSVAVCHDADVIASHLHDAAHVPGGHSPVLFSPSSEAEVAEILRGNSAVLPIGAQSSLTGGATPMGEALLSTAKFNHIGSVQADRVRVGAGVPIATLDQALDRVGRYYPPSPTFTGAFVGGTVSTNAAGAATFKYGTTRQWVEALTIVLATGDVLDVTRGEIHAHPDGYFELELARGLVRVPVPSYRIPHVVKLSAGYFAQPAMDLIDLFIGAEGTLGVITEVTLRVVVTRPAFCLAFTTCPDRQAALSVVGRLREEAARTWRTADPRGIDVSAIEHMDARCLGLLREDGVDKREGIVLPVDSAIALLVTLELPAGTTAAQAYDEIGRAGDSDSPDTPLTRFCTMLSDFDLLERTTIAAPGDRARALQLLNVREAVPSAVNMRVGRAQQSIDRRIEKTAADMVVPFDRLSQLLDFYDAESAARGLDGAVWGHVSDGNLHPNVIPSSFADVESGREAILRFGEETIRLGGAPLAEHGVGRNRTKQHLLAMMYGERGLEEMRRVKEALDPDWKLAPGVIFQRV